MDEKRILIISQHYWPEPFRISDLAEGFTQLGIKVDVLCGLPNYPNGEWYEGYSFFYPRKQVKNNIAIYRAGEIRRKGNTNCSIFLNYISWPFCAVLNLWRLRNKYDAVYCFNTSPILMCIPALIYGKLRKIPVIEFVGDLWPENLYSVLKIENSFLKGIADKICKAIYKSCDKIITVSPGVQNIIQSRTGKRDEDFSIIPQYCEDFYACTVYDKELAEKFKGTFNIVYAGNLSPAQDMDTLIEAFSMLRNSYKERVHLWIIGDGMSKQNVEKKVKMCELQDIVTLWGRVEPVEIPKFTSMADVIYIGLAKSSNLGLTVPSKVSSVLAAGKPVLACLDGNAADAIRDANCGIVCESGDIDALKNAIEEMLLCDEEQKGIWGRNAKAEYYLHYSREKNIRKTAEVIYGGNL